MRQKGHFTENRELTSSAKFNIWPYEFYIKKIRRIYGGTEKFARCNLMNLKFLIIMTKLVDNVT